MLSVEDWAEVRRLYRAERMSISQIARVLGISRNTVRAAVASDGPPKYERKPAGSIVDPVEPRIRELLKAYPSMPATVIAERIGWTRSIRVLSGRVAEAVCASPAGPHTDRDLVQVIRDRHPGKHGQWGPPLRNGPANPCAQRLRRHSAQPRGIHLAPSASIQAGSWVGGGLHIRRHNTAWSCCITRR